MNTYSINVNFSQKGFDVNFFNQFDTYLSYNLFSVIVFSIIILRIRKIVKNKKAIKKSNTELINAITIPEWTL